MVVTINTDASYYENQKRGSYAFWIVSDKFKIQRFGLLRGDVESSTAAEYRCIINAMFILAAEDLSDVGLIVINTDSMNVLHSLMQSKRDIKKYRLSKLNQYHDSFMAILKRIGYDKKRIHVRHVRAHTGVDDRRSHVNEWCDTKAKEVLRKTIKLPN